MLGLFQKSRQIEGMSRRLPALALLVVVGLILYGAWSRQDRTHQAAVAEKDSENVIEQKRVQSPAAPLPKKESQVQQENTPGENMPRKDLPLPTSNPPIQPSPPKIDPSAPSFKFPNRVKKSRDLAKELNAAKSSNAADLLKDLSETSEFRSGATETRWSGNYFGAIGWTDSPPESPIKSEPAVINLGAVC